MDDIHQTGHQLRNKGTSKIDNRAYDSRASKAEASTERHKRHTTIQVLHSTNGEHNRHNSRYRSLRGQGLGRTRNNEGVNDRLCHQVHGCDDTLWQPRTGSNCTQQRRSRTLRHQHRSNRSTTQQEFLDRSSQQTQGQHQDTYRFLKRKEHGNTDRVIKESKTQS